MRTLLTVILAGALGVGALGCETKHDEKSFRKAAEEAYREVNAGWMIEKRTPAETIFVRGDQLDRLPVADLFKAYQDSKQSGGDFFDAWKAEQTKLIEARRRTVEQAKDEIIPILKSGSWVKVQDLGAIGPARMRDQIRPWRKEVATDLYVVLGVPEAKLGYRLASVEEITNALHEQSSASNEIARRVEQIAVASEENSAAVRNTANSARSLEDVSAHLRASIARFRLR